MALLDTVSSVVRVPLRVAGKAVGTVTGTVSKVLPGGRSAPPQRPLDTRAEPAPEPVAATRKTPVEKPPAKGPVEPVAKKAAAKKAPAKKAPAKKAPAAKAPAAKKAPAKKAAPKLPPPVAEPIAEPVTAIDADAPVDPMVKPTDIAPVAGSQLDESAAAVETDESTS